MTNYAYLSLWESIMLDLRDATPSGEYNAKIAGALMISADEEGGAFVEVATEELAEWWRAHMLFLIRRKLLSHGIRVMSVSIVAAVAAVAAGSLAPEKVTP